MNANISSTSSLIETGVQYGNFGSLNLTNNAVSGSPTTTLNLTVAAGLQGTYYVRAYAINSVGVSFSDVYWVSLSRMDDFYVEQNIIKTPIDYTKNIFNKYSSWSEQRAMEVKRYIE